MSTDDVDASDVMNSGGADDAAVRFDELDEDQRKTYQTLVQRGARYVRDGVLTLEQCSLGQLLEDNEQPAETFINQFHDDIEAELEELGESSTERRKRQQQQKQTTTTDPRKIDWPQVWEECNVQPNKPLSGTQLALAIDVSTQTPVTDEGAERLINGAVEADRLQYFSHKKRYAPVEGGGR